MKSFSLLLAFLSSFAGYCQNQQLFAIAPYPLEVTYGKTVNIVFPYAIKSVDRGSRGIIVQKANSADNVLQVKAASPQLVQTNLTVITSDGELYSFLADYAQNPLQLNLQILKGENQPSAQLKGLTSEAWVDESAKQASLSASTILRNSDRKGGVRFSLKGMHVKNDILFCKLVLDNRSNISYQQASLRFLIRDKKQGKRSAVQQTELGPLYKLVDNYPVPSDSSQVLVFALPKFTIPDKKILSVQITEKNGGRHMNLTVRNKSIVRARRLP